MDGKSPASRFQLSVNASGLNGSLSSSIDVTSTIDTSSTNGSVTFVQGTDKLHLPVSVSVLAITYLRKEDVAISFKVDHTPVSLSSIPAGTSLRVVVETRDCDRLIVDRPDQQLRLVLSSSLGGYASQKVALVYKECDRCAGLFEAELSGTWLSDPGTYVLEVRSEDSEDPSVVTLTFDTFDPSRAQIAQGAVVGTLGACIIAGMCFMIYRNPKRAKQLLLSFVTTEFKMLFTTTSEVWDIVGARPFLDGQRCVGLKCWKICTCSERGVFSRAGDTLVFTTFLAASHDESYKTKLHDLTVAYWVCICQAMLVSLIALAHKLYEWRHQLRSRLRAARDAGIETQQTRQEVLLAKIANAKKTCIAYLLAVLVAVFEARPTFALPFVV